ncbi:MAG: class I SAM-dependent methyltransferase [Ardenticatenaceae bacterium]|nr:class I SAM-dependent methyltransferase [Ardenticatenaceae bacterium]
MAHDAAARWNGRYTKDGSHWQNRRPRQLLVEFAHLLPESGLALDAAAGVALHGLFLAERGLHVIALDISEVGLRLARESAIKRGVWLETAVCDLAHPWLPANYFDVIVNFRFLERATFPMYRQALKQGGLLFFETFVKIDPQKEYPEHYLDPGELQTAFADFDIIHYGRAEILDDQSRPIKASEQLVARKR